MSRYPITGVIGTPFGVFRRTDGKWHWGVDIAAARGTEVVAPEDVEVVRVWEDDKTPPFVGYGPGGVLARAIAPPQRYHLLAHLAPGQQASVGDIIHEGERIGEISAVGHVHWEIRREPVDGPDTRPRNTYDPVLWVATGALVEKSRGGGLFVWLLLWWLVSRG